MEAGAPQGFYILRGMVGVSLRPSPVLPVVIETTHVSFRHFVQTLREQTYYNMRAPLRASGNEDRLRSM